MWLAQVDIYRVFPLVFDCNTASLFHMKRSFGKIAFVRTMFMR